MNLLLISLALLALSGLIALLSGRKPALALAASAAGSVLAAAIGLAPAMRALGGAPVDTVILPWLSCYGRFILSLDALSAFFLLPVFLIGGLGAVYAVGYLRRQSAGRNIGMTAFLYHVLLISMIVVLLARDAVLFLVAWELMALSSFGLVMFEGEKDAVRRAGWTYLAASQAGTIFLFFLFLLLGFGNDSFEFDRFASIHRSPPFAGILFLLAVVGFGTKAGFVPLHVWLPEAHPAAPSHVSALMSGVMIKLGIYGIVRTFLLLGAVPAWCAWLMVAIGLSSGVLGVLFALAQHDIKRLLAYHSVENIGIMALGIGLGMLGIEYRAPVVAALGFGGGLLHVLNHALFKSLLFFSAGAVAHETGLRDIERLGGLAKKMPVTAAVFLVGAAAISGLPPLNGFISEFLIYLGAFRGLSISGPGFIAWSLAVVIGLALIGGLALACFTKAFGVVFLGAPRSDLKPGIADPGWTMRGPMLLLAAACLLIGLAAPWIVPLTGAVLAGLPGLDAGALDGAAALPLFGVIAAAFGFLALVALLAALRLRLLRDREVRTAVTWDCGYAAPSARMQYTGSSFAQPLIALFAPLLQTRAREVKPDGGFPAHASFSSETPDVFIARLYRPAARLATRPLMALRKLQHGNVQVYILYIAVTLIALLIWRLG